MTRSVLPPGRRQRFDEGRLGGIVIIAAGSLVSGLLILLGRALRAGDENLADF